MRREFYALVAAVGLWAVIAGLRAQDGVRSNETSSAAVSETEAVAVSTTVAEPANAAVVRAEPKPAARAESLVEQIRRKADLEGFRRLEACLDEESGCAVVEVEPRSRHLWVVEQTLENLRWIRQAFLALSDDQRARVRGDVARLSHWALEFPDDGVREEGLRLARVSMDRDELVSAVIPALGGSVSAPLYEEGLEILRLAVADGADRRDIENFLVTTLDRGGFYAAEETARQLLPFIDRDNVERFRRLSARLAPGSNAALFVTENIREFERLQTGG